MEVARAGERVEVRVEDSGPGVPAAYRERIFDRFFRVNRAERDGSGLGLSIARRIVEIHGGWMEAGRSERLAGLAVEVSFPAAPSVGPGTGDLAVAQPPAHKDLLRSDG